MPAQPQLDERDLELLSAYIDGEITPAERTMLEQRLAQEPALRRELTTLRQTVSWINALPTTTAPRNFTLTPQMVGRQPAKVLFFPASAFVSTLSAIAAVLLVAAGLLLVVQRDMGQTSQPLMLSREQAEIALAPTETPTQKLAATEADVLAEQSEPLALPVPVTTQVMPAAPLNDAITADEVEAAEEEITLFLSNTHIQVLPLR